MSKKNLCSCKLLQTFGTHKSVASFVYRGLGKPISMPSDFHHCNHILMCNTGGVPLPLISNCSKKKPCSCSSKLFKNSFRLNLECHSEGAILFSFFVGKVPSSAAAAAPSREAASNLKDSLQPAITAALNLVSTAASGQASTTTASSGSTSASSPASTSVSTASPVPAAVKKQRPLLPKETAQAVQRAVVWNPTKFQTSSQKWHMQKVQRQQQHGEQSAVQTQAQSQGQTRSPQQLQSQKQDSSSTRYQTRQAAKGNSTSLIIHLNIKYNRIHWNWKMPKFTFPTLISCSAT